jgi:hypothetical protein
MRKPWVWSHATPRRWTVPQVQFVRGNFEPYRAVMGFHLGAIAEDLQEGEVILFDGMTMRRGSAEHPMSNLRAAIKAGWLVPEDQEGGEYIPKPAGVKIHAAGPKGMDRGEGFEVTAAHDEERDLGNREDIRAAAAQQAKAQKPAAVQARKTGAAVIGEEYETLQDGTAGAVVGKIVDHKEGATVRASDDTSKPVKSVVISTGSTKDQAIKSSIAGREGVRVRKRARASGDVTTARAGDNLEDLLPDAASSGVPEAGEAGEGLTEEEQIARQEAMLAERKKKLAGKKAEENRQARLAQVGAEPTAAVTVSKGSEAVGGEETGEVIATVSGEPAEEVDEVPAEAIIQAKMEMIQQFVPGFKWDFKLHWQKRVKAALNFKDQMPVLNAILSIETDAVKKHVMKQLYG